jgi:ABC-type multidrug transport system fused ATPase/permease subunit
MGGGVSHPASSQEGVIGERPSEGLCGTFCLFPDGAAKTMSYMDWSYIDPKGIFTNVFTTVMLSIAAFLFAWVYRGSKKVLRFLKDRKDYELRTAETLKKLVEASHRSVSASHAISYAENAVATARHSALDALTFSVFAMVFMIFMITADFPPSLGWLRVIGTFLALLLFLLTQLIYYMATRRVRTYERALEDALGKELFEPKNEDKEASSGASESTPSA